MNGTMKNLRRIVMKTDLLPKSSFCEAVALIIFVSATGFATIEGYAGEDIPAYRLPVPDKFKFPAEQQNLDVYKVGRFDFDRDGVPEQIIITSGGGSSGPIWYIARLNGEKISDEIQGDLAILKSRNGFPDLRVEHKCGADERYFELYRYNGSQYVCIRKEIHNYKSEEVKIVK